MLHIQFFHIVNYSPQNLRVECICSCLLKIKCWQYQVIRTRFSDKRSCCILCLLVGSSIDKFLLWFYSKWTLSIRKNSKVTVVVCCSLQLEKCILKCNMYLFSEIWWLRLGISEINVFCRKQYCETGWCNWYCSTVRL